jgi:hypothetical protein
VRNTELYLEKVCASCRLMPNQVLSNWKRQERVVSNHVHRVTINVNKMPKLTPSSPFMNL